jgi:hypothetical protein
MALRFEPEVEIRERIEKFEMGAINVKSPKSGKITFRWTLQIDPESNVIALSKIVKC